MALPVLSTLATLRALPLKFAFDPAQGGQAPALHIPMSLSPVITAPVNLYISQRDKPELTRPQRPNVDPRQQRALGGFGFYSIPGWGNFTFGAKTLNFAQATMGHGATHISVSEDGTVQNRGNFKIVGDPDLSLCPEWLNEVPTIILRLWCAKQNTAHHSQTAQKPKPERNIVIGHSKGGNLVYVLASLRQSLRDGKLKEFVQNLKNEGGTRVLQGLPLNLIREVAEDLNDDILGTMGAPLYGIQNEFANLANLRFFSLGFNELTGNSAHYFTAEYMAKVYQATGYTPNQVLDFVVTSDLESFDDVTDKIFSGVTTLLRLYTSPLLQGTDTVFRGLSRFVIPGSQHDGVAPASYPVTFEHHIHLKGTTHLDQAENPQAMKKIFQELIDRGLLK